MSRSSTCTPTREDDWVQLLARLPGDLDRSAFQYGALYRKRGVPNAATFLRLIFAYATGLPLATVSVWAAATGVATLSAVALDKRLRQATAWLQHLVAAVLLQRAASGDRLPLRVRIADATHVQRPGRTSADQRLHLGMDLWHLRLDFVKRTSAAVGEHLKHLAMTVHDVVLVDRGLASRPGLWAVARAGAFSVARLPWAFPLQTPDGHAWQVAAHARNLAPGTAQEWAVETRPTKQVSALPGRVIVYHLTAEEQARARTARARKGRKTYRKDRPATTHADGLEKCAYLILWTTLPTTLATCAQVLALYRLRWQIELLIKRLKQLLQLGEMRARTDALTETTLYAKLLLALLGEDLCHQGEVFSP